MLWGWHTLDAVQCGCNLNACEAYAHPKTLSLLLNRGGLGFASWFRDPPGTPISNQIGHFWEYVAVAFMVELSYEGAGWWAAVGGNTYHELTGKGNSFEDWLLGLKGADLGYELAHGRRPFTVSRWIREKLGPIDLFGYPIMGY